MEDISEKGGKRGRTRRLIALNNKTHPCAGARACDVATAGVSDEITPRRFRPRRCHYNITTILPLCHDRPRIRPFSGSFAPPSVEDAAVVLLLWPLPAAYTIIINNLP